MKPQPSLECRVFMCMGVCVHVFFFSKPENRLNLPFSIPIDFIFGLRRKGKTRKKKMFGQEALRFHHVILKEVTARLRS